MSKMILPGCNHVLNSKTLSSHFKEGVLRALLHPRYLLLVLVILCLVKLSITILAILFTVSSMADSPTQCFWTAQYAMRASLSSPIDMDAFSSTSINRCLAPRAGNAGNALDISNMAAYNNQCRTDRLTFVPLPTEVEESDVRRWFEGMPNFLDNVDNLDNIGGDVGDIGNAVNNVNNVESDVLSVIAKHPLGSPCSCPRPLHAASAPMPTTALLSFPGSGNTWARHLIEQLTGVHSGSVYHFSDLKKEGTFRYEGVMVNVSVVKTHKPPGPRGILNYWDYDSVNDVIFDVHVTFDQMIVLLRNPFAAIMSEYKRSQLKLGHVGDGRINPCTQHWNEFVEVWIKRWHEFIKASFESRLPLLIVFYEDMTRSCLMTELIRISAFLRTDTMDQFSLCCVLKEAHEGSYRRDHSLKQTLHEVYSPRLRSMVNRVLLQTASYLQDAYPQVSKRVMKYIVL